MGAIHKLNEFFKTLVFIVCKIGIYIVIISNGIRASGITFYYLFPG